jgi:hypothetical protein
MRWNIAIPVLSAVVSLSAAGAEPGQVAGHPLGMSPVCVAPQQCVAMWTAARSWVRNTCGYRLEKDTGNVLETYNTVNNTVPRQVSRSLACRVTRTARPEGGYVFTVTASCSAISPPTNPCYPPADEATGEFNRSLNAVAARFNH